MVRLLADRVGCSVSVEERTLLDALQVGTTDPGLAPIHLAAKNGHASVVDVLLRNGSNPRVRTVREGPLYAATALHLAAQYGHIVSMPYAVPGLAWPARRAAAPARPCPPLPARAGSCRPVPGTASPARFASWRRSPCTTWWRTVRRRSVPPPARGTGPSS